jgi:hypothetical protein
MDGDSKQKKKNRKEKRNVSYVRDVLSALWVRFSVQNDYGYHWFFLGSRYHFLLNLRVFFLVVYLLFQAVK